jgi:hypothetical protein
MERKTNCLLCGGDYPAGWPHECPTLQANAPAGYRLQPLSEYEAMIHVSAQVDDLALLVKRLTRAIGHNIPVCRDAEDYLRRHGLDKSKITR